MKRAEVNPDPVPPPTEKLISIDCGESHLSSDLLTESSIDPLSPS